VGARLVRCSSSVRQWLSQRETPRLAWLAYQPAFQSEDGRQVRVRQIVRLDLKQSVVEQLVQWFRTIDGYQRLDESNQKTGTIDSLDAPIVGGRVIVKSLECVHCVFRKFLAHVHSIGIAVALQANGFQERSIPFDRFVRCCVEYRG
jgi:hypothetical protein